MTLCTFCLNSEGVPIDAKCRQNVEDLTGIGLHARVAGHLCHDCLQDLRTSMRIKERFVIGVKLLNDQNESPGEVDWLEMLPEVWINIMGFLNQKDRNAMHLVCKKFDGILNQHIKHKIRLSYVGPEKLEELRGSSRRYDEAKISIMTEFRGLASIFRDVGIHLRKFKFTHYRCESLADVYNLLKTMPNLEWLQLKGISNEDFQCAEPLNLPKLKYLKVADCSTNILTFFEECKMIEEVEFIEWKNSRPEFIKIFLLLHQRSLKKINIDLFRVNSFSFVGLDEMKLESLRLASSSGQVLEFLRTQAGTLTTFKYHASDTDQQFLDFVSKNLQKLEVLQIFVLRGCTVQRYDGFSRLKRLKTLKFYGCNVLHGLLQEVNENLEELEIPIDDISDDILKDLQMFLPNLKKLTIPSMDLYETDRYLRHFENLEHLVISSQDGDTHFLRVLELVRQLKNLKKVSVLPISGESKYSFQLENLCFEY